MRNALKMDDEEARIATYVETAAAMAGMHLDQERREAVVGVMKRIAAFARDLDDLPIEPDIEVAGRFVP